MSKRVVRRAAAGVREAALPVAGARQLLQRRALRALPALPALRSYTPRRHPRHHFLLFFFRTVYTYCLYAVYYLSILNGIDYKIYLTRSIFHLAFCECHTKLFSDIALIDSSKSEIQYIYI